MARLSEAPIPLAPPVTTATLPSSESSVAPLSSEERPEHHLDYFHGGLVVSPGGRRIADEIRGLSFAFSSRPALVQSEPLMRDLKVDSLFL